MPNVTYGTPPGGGYEINSNAYGGGGGAGGSGMGGGLDWMMNLARRKAEQEAALRSLQLKEARSAAGPQLSSSDPYDRAMRDLDMRERVAEVDAKTRPAPMKTSFTANAMGGYTRPDENAMNAFQRQAFLPQGSGFSGGGPGPSRASLSSGGIGGPPDFSERPEIPGESIEDMSRRMYGDWRGNSQRREAFQYGKESALLGGRGIR